MPRPEAVAINDLEYDPNSKSKNSNYRVSFRILPRLLDPSKLEGFLSSLAMVGTVGILSHGTPGNSDKVLKSPILNVRK